MLTPDEGVMLFLMLVPLIVFGLLAWILKFVVAIIKYLYKIFKH
jgi:hypothetical protein